MITRIQKPEDKKSEFSKMLGDYHRLLKENDKAFGKKYKLEKGIASREKFGGSLSRPINAFSRWRLGKAEKQAKEIKDKLYENYSGGSFDVDGGLIKLLCKSQLMQDEQFVQNYESLYASKSSGFIAKWGSVVSDAILAVGVGLTLYQLSSSQPQTTQEIYTIAFPMILTAPIAAASYGISWFANRRSEKYDTMAINFALLAKKAESHRQKASEHSNISQESSSSTAA